MSSEYTSGKTVFGGENPFDHLERAPKAAHATDHAHADDGDPHVHVVSWQFMTGVFVTLLIMTLLTVWTALEVNLGDTGNLILAIGIATFKGALVVGFFMHLHWDSKINAVILLYCLLAMFCFFLFTTIDLGSRAWVDETRAQTIAPDIVERARENAKAAGEDHDGSHSEEGEHSGEGEAGEQDSSADESHASAADPSSGAG